MVYGPRDEDELATVLGIVAASHAYASGHEAARLTEIPAGGLLTWTERWAHSADAEEQVDRRP